MEGPFGTAQDFNTPSSSRRRSYCRRVAACFCTTNSRSPAPSAEPLGSVVFLKSRLRRYSARSATANSIGNHYRFWLRLGVGRGRTGACVRWQAPVPREVHACLWRRLSVRVIAVFPNHNQAITVGTPGRLL